MIHWLAREEKDEQLTCSNSFPLDPTARRLARAIEIKIAEIAGNWTCERLLSPRSRDCGARDRLLSPSRDHGKLGLRQTPLAEIADCEAHDRLLSPRSIHVPARKVCATCGEYQGLRVEAGKAHATCGRSWDLTWFGSLVSDLNQRSQRSRWTWLTDGLGSQLTPLAEIARWSRWIPLAEITKIAWSPKIWRTCWSQSRSTSGRQLSLALIPWRDF